MDTIAGKKDFAWMRVSGTLLSGATTINLTTGHAARAPNDGYNELLVFDHGNYPGNPMEAYWNGAAEIFSYTDAPDTGADQLTNVTRGASPVNFTTAGDYRIVSPFFLADVEALDDALGVCVTSARFGADKTGATDSASAINAAADRAGATKAVVIPGGTYKVGSAITFHGPTICVGDVLFDYEGANTTTAITYRHTSAGANLLANLRFDVPRVVHDGTIGASDSHVGVKFINCDGCVASVPHVDNFYLALAFLADGATVRNSQLHLGEIEGYHIACRVRSEQAGGTTVSSLRIIGGAIHSTAHTALESGSRYFEIGNGTGTAPTRVIVDGADLYGNAPEYYVWTDGTNNHFRLARWPDNADVYFDTGANGNRIFAAEGTDTLDFSGASIDAYVERSGAGKQTTKTISSGLLTIDGASRFITVAAESGTTDTLQAVAGPYPEGTIVYLQADSGDTITIQDAFAGANEIHIEGGNRTMSGDEIATLIRRSDGDWYFINLASV